MEQHVGPHEWAVWRNDLYLVGRMLFREGTCPVRTGMTPGFSATRLPNIFSSAVNVTVMIRFKVFTDCDLGKITVKCIRTSESLPYCNSARFIDIPV